jgi:hypothetical protein
MSETVVNALLAVALTVVSGVLGIIGAWAKAKYSNEQLRGYERKATTVVNAAEQMGALAGWDGSKKKEYAETLLVKAGLKPDQAEAFVEAAVADLINFNSQLVKDEAGSVVKKTPDCSE